MSYRETLPEGCPPVEAAEITNTQVVFRVVKDRPPVAEDFLSQRALKPTAKFQVSECQARGLSVFTRKQDCANLLRLAHMRGRQIAKVILEAGAGRIQQTGQPSHHTWWPLAEFDILVHCEMEAA
jgi:hypothetical protein